MEIFEHKGRKMTKQQVLKVLIYAENKGYENISQLVDVEIDLVLGLIHRTEISLICQNCGKEFIVKDSTIPKTTVEIHCNHCPSCNDDSEVYEETNISVKDLIKKDIIPKEQLKIKF